jgi:predicted nucleotidyltransferase
MKREKYSPNIQTEGRLMNQITNVFNPIHVKNEPVGYTYIPLIVEKLKPIHPWKVILFGSYAYGTPNQESDIDLLVVLNSEETPQSFQDNLKNKLLVRKMIWDVSTQVSVDLLVYTKPMYQRFQELGSMFAREIEQRGKILYETDHP